MSKQLTSLDKIFIRFLGILILFLLLMLFILDHHNNQVTRKILSECKNLGFDNFDYKEYQDHFLRFGEFKEVNCFRYIIKDNKWIKEEYALENDMGSMI